MSESASTPSAAPCGSNGASGCGACVPCGACGACGCGCPGGGCCGCPMGGCPSMPGCPMGCGCPNSCGGCGGCPGGCPNGCPGGCGMMGMPGQPGMGNNPMMAMMMMNMMNMQKMMANGGDKQNPMAAMMAGMGNMGGVMGMAPSRAEEPKEKEKPLTWKDDDEEIDPDVRELGDYFNIEERWVVRLNEAMKKRQETKAQDVEKLYEVLEKARSPTGLLTVQIGKMECGQFVGKVKPDKDVERMARKFKLDDHVTSRLTELKVWRQRNGEEDRAMKDLERVEFHLRGGKGDKGEKGDRHGHRRSRSRDRRDDRRDREDRDRRRERSRS